MRVAFEDAKRCDGRRARPIAGRLTFAGGAPAVAEGVVPVAGEAGCLPAPVEAHAFAVQPDPG